MKVLSSTNPSSLAPVPANSSSLQLQSTPSRVSTKATPSLESPMTLSASTTMSPNFPNSDRSTGTNSAELLSVEHSNNIKVEEGETKKGENASVASEKPYMEIDQTLEYMGNASWVRERSFESTEAATAEKPNLEDVTTQIRSLAEFFNTFASATSTMETTVASLNSLMGKMSKQEAGGSDSSSLEALHKLGWQLIRLGRNASTPQKSSIPAHPCPLLVSTCMQQPFPLSPKPPSPPSSPSSALPMQSPKPLQTIQQPHSPIAGISMRGNQRYSEFYQQSKKHQVMEEAEPFRKPPTTAVPPLNRIGLSARNLSGLFPSSNTRSGPEPSVKPSAVGQRSQSELVSLSRNRDTAFLCSCGDDFESLYCFTLHMRDTGHKPRSSQPERDIPKLVRGQDMWINSETEQTREILRCMRCNHSFRSLPELTMHMVKTSHYCEIVYSDAARNILANQTLSSTKERNRNTVGSKASFPHLSLKKSIRNISPLQSGSKRAESYSIDKTVSEQSEDHFIAAKLPRLGEVSQKCDRPASSHEMHVVNHSQRLTASPEPQSCPSELQRSNVSSPQNEAETQEPKYLGSSSYPGSETASPHISEEEPSRQGCMDSVIRQMESFVENRLPFPRASSRVSSRPSAWLPGIALPPNYECCNTSALIEMDEYRSIQDKNVQLKHPYSNASSKPVASNSATASATSADKPPLLPSLSESTGFDNPLSSLQKLVETTHQSGTGLKNPIRPFSQTSDGSPIPSNNFTDVDVSRAPTSAASTAEANQQQSNIAAIFSAAQNFMPKSSPSDLSYLYPSNNKDDNTNWMRILGAFLTLTKQLNDSEAKRLDRRLPTSSHTFEQPSAVFPGGGFDFNSAQSVPMHTISPLMNSTDPNVVANINKKAKCHFCGKAFANKGQVRLHISKNKCPCLLQQSVLAKSSTGVVLNVDKRESPYSYPGHSTGDFSRLFPPLPSSYMRQSTSLTSNPPMTTPRQSSQQKLTASTPPPEAAAFATLLRHFSAPQTSRPTDRMPSLTESTEPSINPILSILSPSSSTSSPAPPPAQPVDMPGLTADQKALFLFAQAIMSLALASPNADSNTEKEMTPRQPPTPQLPTYLPSASPLPNFSLSPTLLQEVAMNPEALSSYLSAIRHLASFGNAAAVTTMAETKTTGSLLASLTGAERLG